MTYADEPPYTTTGWHQMREYGEWRFAHAGGLLGWDGNYPAATDLGEPLSRYRLTDPITDGEEVRQAWNLGLADLLAVDHVAVPLIGAAFRAAIGSNNTTVGLVGPPAVFKSSVAAIVMHHFGTEWSADTLINVSASTPAAINQRIAVARDVLVPLDDVRDDETLHTLVRRFAAGQGRVRMNSRGDLDALPTPAGLGLVTSERRPVTASGLSRWLGVEIWAEDFSTDLIERLTRPESRAARNRLMSTFIVWLSRRLTSPRHDWVHRTGEFLAELSRENIRLAARSAQELYGGWCLLLDFLEDWNAIGASELVDDQVREVLVRTARDQETFV
ncbi:hypothetical protein ACFV9C_42430 [Kribbella sp. NPDC059898]|uniref:hypothetical protein n=1 Tax=Kribbella sp. NPDC059898 TaxID=3346995 RepID=UPI00365E0FEC